MSLRDYPFRIFYSPADDPLNNFYIPALSGSVQYDRSAGFFSSSALAVAAAGVARLLQNGGRMRLLVGAALHEDDVNAIQKGHDLKTRVTERLLQHFHDPQDALLRQRLEVIAWMIAEGTLEIKVVLPTDARGNPLSAEHARDYYHPKTGIFTDATGAHIAFSGSVNESETAWQRNYETFSVYFSWNETKAYLEQVAITFERLWNGKEQDWLALDVPTAVREKLLTFRPAHPPTHDPLERKISASALQETLRVMTDEIPHTERVLFQFVRDALYLPTASGLGAATSAIVPWPHQTRVADEIIRRFPDRALLADEVGLGKTIEAGLVIRQLVLSGRVKRALILAPKSVLKQWQEELYEKFVLDVPRFDQNKFWNVHGQQLETQNENPWDAFDLMLAGSQLAKRADRREQILAARGWDLIIVDEAHHARRKDFKERIYRPNRLLGLLNEINTRDKAAAILLMTATPMQVHPLEVWDLLTVLGMGGKWRADEDNFLKFFGELRRPLADTDWEFVFDLVQDYLATGHTIDSNFAAQAVAELGAVKWSEMQTLPARRGERAQILNYLGNTARPFVAEMARRHTPLQHYFFRNTRELLREYQRRGILNARVPHRHPRIERVPLTPEEQKLYDRIEEYTSHFYAKYENERRGMGFIMTIYRRRLTSSFYAVRCSLERRLKFLRGVLRGDELFDDDDIEQDDLEQDVAEEILSATERERFRAERDYVEDFIQSLQLLSVTDSKMERLKQELHRTFLQRDTVLVFTQYTDTMDFVRDQLRQVYGARIACYSGRGGEVWNGIAWIETTKEEVKQKFRDGEIQILLCTESASEGLNLQTCGALINYDMPWNPMRVEQRIGRIDRIGQQYDDVSISNYFYENTIEDLIYQRLKDRIDWFEVVVGDLQPILVEVGQITQRLAMLPQDARAEQFELEIRALRQRLQHRQAEALSLDEFILNDDSISNAASPIQLADLERLLTTAQCTKHLFRLHPELPNAYLCKWDGEMLPVTFSRECFDEHPDTVRFLSYGNPMLDELLAQCPEPTESESFNSIVRFNADEPVVRAYFAVSDTDQSPESITTFAQLERLISKPESAPSADSLAAAQTIFESQVADIKRAQTEILKHRHTAVYLAEYARAQRLLIQAALVEIALGQQPELLASEIYPSAFTTEAVYGLQRRRYPWSAMVSLAYEVNLIPSPDDPYFVEIRNQSREALRARFGQLTSQARELVPRVTSTQTSQTSI